MKRFTAVAFALAVVLPVSAQERPFLFSNSDVIAFCDPDGENSNITVCAAYAVAMFDFLSRGRQICPPMNTKIEEVGAVAYIAALKADRNAPAVEVVIPAMARRWPCADKRRAQ